MSQIANALHKAKERTGLTSAPFMVPGHAPVIVVPPKVKNVQHIWILLLSVVIVFGGLSMWYSGRFNLSGTDSTPPPATNQNQTTGSGTEKPTKPDTEPVSKSETQDIVNSLVISAVMPGSTPRIMMKGHVVSVGQEAESGLTFAGIQGDKLMFTDSGGATYTRRY
jgi:hypothetical protein